MRCPTCHHDNQSDRRFCTHCGAELAVGCLSCGAPIEVGEKFCGGCGAALTIGGRTTAPSPAHAPLLTEKFRQAKAPVEGERKQVTLLRCGRERKPGLVVTSDSSCSASRGHGAPIDTLMRRHRQGPRSRCRENDTGAGVRYGELDGGVDHPLRCHYCCRRSVLVSNDPIISSPFTRNSPCAVWPLIS